MLEKENLEEKWKERNINFFTCLDIHGKIKGEKKKNSFSFVWLTMKKSQRKMEGKQNQQFVLDGYQYKLWFLINLSLLQVLIHFSLHIIPH